MASLRDIRRRIKSIGSIKQITRAMEMVATTKLRRFQARAQASRPFTEVAEQIFGRILALAPPDASPLLEGAPRKGPIGLLIVTSDRGLCGAYNANMIAFVRRHLVEANLATPDGRPLAEALRFYVIGRKGYVLLSKRGFNIAQYFADPPLEKLDRQGVPRIVRRLTKDFLDGSISELRVFATRFESMITFRPSETRLLPIKPPRPPRKETGVDPLVEPDVKLALELLLPAYLEAILANLLFESLASEYASRRMSMKNATDSAEEMRGALLRTYNRARQESITKQLLEIVGGAEALK